MSWILVIICMWLLFIARSNHTYILPNILATYHVPLFPFFFFSAFLKVGFRGGGGEVGRVVSGKIAKWQLEICQKPNSYPIANNPKKYTKSLKRYLDAKHLNPPPPLVHHVSNLFIFLI